MLGNANFYHGSVKKIISCFGVVFSDIHIARQKADGTIYQTLEIPCTYGPKEKWLIRNKQNQMPGTNDQVAMVLPRISYEMTGWQYDSQRKLPSTGRTVKALVSDNSVLKTQFNPVPYNFGFVLHIMTKTLSDGLMIIEQILPFFTPDYTLSVNDLPDLDLQKDIVIVHSGAVQQDDSWDGSMEEDRVITWSLSFTMKAYLYPPTKLNKVNLNSTTNIRLFDETDETTPALVSEINVHERTLSGVANIKKNTKKTLTGRSRIKH